MLLSNIADLLEIEEHNVELTKQYFFEDVLFSYQWWLLLGIMIALWSVWFILVDKQRMLSILLAGCISSLITFVLDDTGRSLHLWFYPHQLTYFSWQFYPVDLAVIPVCYMILYQYIGRWKWFLTTLILLSLFAAFLVEPLFVLLDLYVLIHWEHIYSFPFYILIGVIVKWLTDRVTKGSNTSYR
ncbi:CBO0543 family protein [Lentibacillus sp. N15]|uniref:CBO0543 family protein n=1 Tax=Lentibacillus songyuanensis TaxID=3136161 RepID=UPI0031BB8F58